jgi:hypothetical protein
MIIPAHLGERWNDLSLEQAQKQWKDLYKKNNKKKVLILFSFNFCDAS